MDDGLELSCREKERIQDEIEEIIDGREGLMGGPGLFDLEVGSGKPVRVEAFWFRQHKGFALYECEHFVFTLEWKPKDPPPASIWVEVSMGKNGVMRLEMSDPGLAPLFRKGV